MQIQSPSFAQYEMIPKRFTFDGENLSPALVLHDIPKGVVSFAIIMDDPDAPMGVWDHWVVWNIPGASTVIPEGFEAPREGVTSYGTNGYQGPSPPPGKPHRYFFRVYALDAFIQLEEGSTKQQLQKAIAPHIISQAELIGIYQR